MENQKTMSNMHLCIYQPTGAAAEYGKWACNLYNGCTHGCTYCYCKRGVFKNVLGKDKPELKKQLVGKLSPFNIFQRELLANKEAILKDGDGLFFSFSTDPMLEEEIGLTIACVKECINQGIPVQILTKATWFTHKVPQYSIIAPWRHANVKLGWTLTGHDELEPGAPSNEERIEAFKQMTVIEGMDTFISLEPVVDFKSTMEMIKKTWHWCTEYRIGLMSPFRKDHYDWRECDDFIKEVNAMAEKYKFQVKWKNSIRTFHEKSISRNLNNIL